MKLSRQPITYILPEKTARRIKLMAESANMSEADFITILAATECMTKYPTVERQIEQEFEGKISVSEWAEERLSSLGLTNADDLDEIIKTGIKNFEQEHDRQTKLDF